MAEIRQKSLIEMSRQLEEMRAHQAQQTEAEEQRSRAQELRSQAMQENISRMMEMMQTLMPRPVTYPSSSNHGNTTTPTLPHPSPRPPDPVVVTGTGNSAAAEQHVAHRAPLNSPGSNRSTDGASKIAENLNQGELTLGTDPSDLAAHDVLEEMSQSTKIIEVIGVSTKDDDDDLLEMASWIEEDFEPNSAKESSVLVAHQVLDKMPRSFVSGELIFLDEIEKINEELVDGFNWEATPMSSVEELEGVKVLKESKLRNTIPTTHAFKLQTEFSEKESMMNGVVCVLCFDPGGNNPSHRDHDMCLSNKNFESAAGEDHISVDGIFSELRKSYFAAGQDTQISYAAEHELQVAAAQDGLKVFRGGMTMIYMGLMCFDPGGLLVINAFSCLIANEKPHFGYSVGTLIFYPGSYVAEVLVFLQAFDYEMSAYLGWSAEIKSCSLDVLKETSNMLSCSLGNTKPDEEHKTLKVFEVKDLKYITPLLLVINESSDFVQFPSKLPAQKVRMVDYIVVVCFNVWVFDPGGHLLIHATFGVAENLLNASAENIIENLLNASAVHGHLDAVFDPRESELISRDRTNCLFNESAFAFVIPSPCLGVDINEARHQRIQITNQHLVTMAAMMGVDTCSHLLNFGEYSIDFSSFQWSMLTVHHD